MKNMKQIIYIFGLVLAMAICLAAKNKDQFSKKSNVDISFELCIDNKIDTHVCHADGCHESTVYVHGCDEVIIDDLCDSLSVQYDVFNTSGWQNTTCDLYACIDHYDDTTANVTMSYQSCTNGVCRNGTSENYFSEDRFPSSNAQFIYNSHDIVFDIPCVNLLYSGYKRVRLNKK